MRVKAGVVAAGRGVCAAVVAMLGSLALFIVVVTSISLIPVGVGVLTTPPLVRTLRGYANMRRRTAHEWFGVEVPVPYRPEPPRDTGLVGVMVRLRWMLK